MPAFRHRFITGLVVGAIIATAVNVFICQLFSGSHNRYVLTAPLDLEECDYTRRHVPGADALLKGTLLPGSTFTVTMEKADINYISFFTMVSDKDLLRISEPVAEGSGRQ